MWTLIFLAAIQTNAAWTLVIPNLPTERACKEFGKSLTDEINKDRWINITPTIICKQIPRQ